MNNEYDINAILERLFYLKDMHGGNGKAICDAAGISNTLYSDWKHGKAKPSLTSVIALSLYFNVDLDWVIFGENSKKNSSVKSETEISLLSKFRSLPPDYQLRVISYIDGMLDTINITEKASKHESLA